jgi:hypothetical protein
MKKNRSMLAAMAISEQHQAKDKRQFISTATPKEPSEYGKRMRQYDQQFKPKVKGEYYGVIKGRGRVASLPKGRYFSNGNHAGEPGEIIMY